MQTRFSHFVFILCLLSLITANISPACAFINGKSTITICAADGSTKTVEVDSEFDPFANPDKEKPITLKKQCQFCFDTAHKSKSNFSSIPPSEKLDITKTTPPQNPSLLIWGYEKYNKNYTRAPPASS